MGMAIWNIAAPSGVSLAVLLVGVLAAVFYGRQRERHYERLREARHLHALAERQQAGLER